mgnify:CR=1 FL=1
MKKVEIKKRFKVIAKPNAKKTEILSQDNNTLKIAIAAPPQKNKANIALIKFLSKKFGKVRLVSGLKSKNKVFERVV